MVSRIAEFTDMATGEVIEDVPAYMTRSYEDGPLGATDRVLAERSAELDVLLYVGRANGRLSPRAKAAVIRFLQGVADGRDLHLQHLGNYLANSRPSQSEFRKALVSLATGDEPGRENVLRALADLETAYSHLDDFTAAELAVTRKRLDGQGPARPKAAHASRGAKRASAIASDNATHALEDAEDLAAVNARRAEEAIHGRETVRRNYLTAEEAERLWAGESPVKVWREKRRLTPHALAESGGIQPEHLAEIEAGRSLGDSETVGRLARVLEVPAGWLSTNRLAEQS